MFLGIVTHKRKKMGRLMKRRKLGGMYARLQIGRDERNNHPAEGVLGVLNATEWGDWGDG